ncbi:MAG: methyltransferase domain-containing protein [Candidatus Levybacteria bacterium]|nr:methyltransferase domain-containing protein [Candidatus Levybacteria bacterium]
MSSSDLDIIEFYSEKIEKLYKNKYFRESLKIKNKQLFLSPYLKDTRISFKKAFSAELEQAEITISMLEKLEIDKNKSILEIGGGIGIVYGFLRKMGYNIYSIEPSESGFMNQYNSGIILLNILKIDTLNWYPLKLEEADKLSMQFDIIVSNNVLEHVHDLESSFLILKKLLKKDGAMIHNTVNYHVPYEPHFRIPLFPFFPKLTVFFKPKLKNNGIWKDLHFITSTEIKNICKNNNLAISFYNDRLLNTLKKLEDNSEFSKRHKHFLRIYKFLKHTHTLMFLEKLPISFKTPMQFKIKKVN